MNIPLFFVENRKGIVEFVDFDYMDTPSSVWYTNGLHRTLIDFGNKHDLKEFIRTRQEIIPEYDNLLGEL